MAITTDVEETIRTFLDRVSKRFNITEAYAFGSITKGKRHAWSDIDVAIVSPDFSGDSFEDSKLLIPFILEVDRSIEVHPFCPQDFSPENPFIDKIIKNGVRLL